MSELLPRPRRNGESISTATHEQSVTHPETTRPKRLGRFILSLCLAADPCLVSIMPDAYLLDVNHHDNRWLAMNYGNDEFRDDT